MKIRDLFCLAKRWKEFPKTLLTSTKRLMANSKLHSSILIFSPIFKHARNSNTRKTANIAYGNRCAENDPILEQIIKIRFEIAKLLGYDTFSDYVLEERLAKKKDTVLNFLADLQTKLTPIAEEELKVLRDFKRRILKQELEPEESFYSWDYNYYNERLLEQKYKVDHVKIAEYFPLESTVAKMLGFYEKYLTLNLSRL